MEETIKTHPFFFLMRNTKYIRSKVNPLMSPRDFTLNPEGEKISITIW